VVEGGATHGFAVNVVNTLTAENPPPLAEVQVVPLEVNTLPDVPAAVIPVPPCATVSAVVNVNVPVTSTPALVTATTVEPPLCRFKFPVASAVVTTPPPAPVLALIDEAIYIS
jgi:hypothetical protein